MTPKSTSFVVPTHDDGEGLPQVLLSIAESTVEPHTVLICDDHTTKASSRFALESLAPACARQTIDVISCEGFGLATARNAGLARVSSEFVRFVDADDVLVAGSTDRLTDHMDSATVAIGGTVAVDVESWKPSPQPVMPERPQLASLSEFVAAWESRVSIPIHSALFRTATLRDGGITFPEDLRSKEDFVFWASLVAMRADFQFVDEVVAVYRVTGRSMSHARLGMNGCEYLRALELIAADAINVSPSSVLASLSHFFAFYGPHLSPGEWTTAMSLLGTLQEKALNAVPLEVMRYG